MEGALQLTGIAFVAVAATLCGIAMSRLKQPPIVGYILAGILLGPSGLALVADREQVAVLAELGVLMLLFFIGIELSLRSFRHIWRVAVFTTLMQILVSVGAMLLAVELLGWQQSHAIFFGFVLALSSTAVAVAILEETGELRTRVGRIAVGVLIAQDLAVAPMLLILDSLAGDSSGFDFAVVGKVVVSIAILVGVILYFTRRTKISLPLGQSFVAKADLTPIAAMAWCFGSAAICGIIGLSPAFGAFLGGLLIGNSAQRQAVSDRAHPIQSVLLMVFFLSIGLLIDIRFLIDNIVLVLAMWFFVCVFKTALNALLLKICNVPWPQAFLSSLVLAQLGEFSFVLGAAAIDSQIIDSEIYRLVVAVTVVSLVTAPIWLNLSRGLHHRAARRIDTLGRLLQFIYQYEGRAVRNAAEACVVGARLNLHRGRRWLTFGHRYSPKDPADPAAGPAEGPDNDPGESSKSPTNA